MDQIVQRSASEGRDEQHRVRVLRLARTIKLMLGSLDRPLDLNALAGAACLSRFHFVRQFRELTGDSPQRFHLKLRLQRAAWALITDTASITDIALATGFGSIEGFDRAFHRVYRIAPTDFRKLRADPWSNFSRIGFWRPRISAPAKEGSAVMLEVKQLPAMIYAAVRNVGPYNTVGPAFQRIVGWAASSGLMHPDTKVLGLAWDNPMLVEADKLRYDAAITIDRRIDTPKDIAVGALPAMAWAISVHKGSYARMTESFMALGGEMTKRNDLIHVPLCSLEIYLNDPDDTPEADLLTEIGFPVVRSP
jgi:AraC family transcriptional regulator